MFLILLLFFPLPTPWLLENRMGCRWEKPTPHDGGKAAFQPKLCKVQEESNTEQEWLRGLK